MSDLETNGGNPPAGEEIHMPAPSILPLINAAGLALMIVSITLSWYLVAFGADRVPVDHDPVGRGRPARHRRTPTGPLAPLVP